MDSIKLFPFVAFFLIFSGVQCTLNLTPDDPVSPIRSFIASPPQLISLATKEEIIYMILSDFQKELQRESENETTKHASLSFRGNGALLDLVIGYLKDFDETSGKVCSQYAKQSITLRPQHVAWNPVSTYHMIRRFSTDLGELLEGMDFAKESHLRTYSYIMEVMKGLPWPSENDIGNHMDAILRVQHVYDLNAVELSNGKIHGRDTEVGLRGTDCYAIGKFGMETNSYALAIEWLELAVNKLENESDSLSRAAEEDLERAAETHYKVWENAGDGNCEYYTHKIAPKRQNRNTHFDTCEGRKTEKEIDINFWELCSGENYQEAEEKNKLFCYYESKISNNAWAIRPLKVEILSLNPLVVQYYDVIGDKMIQRVKQAATPSLMPSEVADKYGVATTHHPIRIRTSVNSWISEDTEADFTSIPKIIEAITGMKVKGRSAAEPLQVVAYAFGGHYEAHWDAFNNNSRDEKLGNRIATFMFYLSDVEEVGYTAFPVAGVAAKPVKGSAVYWYNLWSSGKPDERTLHGACPVILGEKWVANKWIGLYDQIRNFKCLPGAKVPHKFLVNGKLLKV